VSVARAAWALAAVLMGGAGGYGLAADDGPWWFVFVAAGCALVFVYLAAEHPPPGGVR
jgi:hypothetical protein